jgi:hypothetical protein
MENKAKVNKKRLNTFQLPVLHVSCGIFGSLGNPALEKLEFMLYSPLSYFDHLVSKVKITIYVDNESTADPV